MSLYELYKYIFYIILTTRSLSFLGVNYYLKYIDNIEMEYYFKN